MGGAPGPVTCCILGLKRQNKKISITFNKCYLVTYRQLHLNKLTTPDSAHIVDVILLVTWLGIKNLAIVKNKVSSCQMVDSWLRDCDYMPWLHQITDKLPTVCKTVQPSLLTHYKKLLIANSFACDVEDDHYLVCRHQSARAIFAWEGKSDIDKWNSFWAYHMAGAMAEGET